MRIPLFLLLLGLLAFAFIGCENDDEDNGTNPVTINVISESSGNAIQGAQVTLFQNGTTVQPAVETGSSGRITFSNVAEGADYRVLITSATDAFAPLLIGPFNVTSDSRTFSAEVLPYSELNTTYGIARPANNTATLAVFAYDEFGSGADLVQASVQIDNGAILGPDSPVVYPDITPGTHDITVTEESTGRTVVFQDVTFTANSILVLRTAFAEVADVTIQGTLTNATTGLAVGNANLRLLQNGQQVATATTDVFGRYTFANIVPGNNYAIEATDSFVRTIFGPGALLQNDESFDVQVYTQTELSNRFANTTAPPSNATARLVVLVEDEDSDNLIPVQVSNGANALTGTATLPASGLIPPGTYDLTITDLNNNQDVVLENVTLTGGTTTLIVVDENTLGEN